MQPSDFPLAWPEGRDRTAPKARIAGRFKIGWRAAYDQLLDEAERLHEGDRDVVVSTNIPLGSDGLPVISLAGARVADPGVCVYVWRGGRPYAIACDTYREVRQNLRALWATIRALRTIRRHGAAALLEQSMVGFCREVEAPVAEPPVRLIAAGQER